MGVRVPPFAPTPTPRPRRAAAAAAAVLISTSLSLAAAEVLLRFTAPDWLHARVAFAAVGDPTGGSDAGLPREYRDGRFVGFTPLRTATLSHPEYRTRVTFDGHGARRGKGQAWNPARGVLVLGDSFTFGVGVGDDEAWPGLWAEASGRPVLNLGAPGSTLTDQLAIIEARHGDLGSPRRCIFAMFLGNDLAELVARRRPAPAQAAQADPPLVSRLNAWSYRNPLTRRSYLFQLARSAAVGAWNASRPVPAMDLAFAAMRRDAPDAAETIEAIAHATADLKDQQSRLGYTAVVMLIPDRYQVLTSLREAKAREYGIPLASLDPGRPARLVSEAMSAAGIHLVDTSQCLADAGARAYYVQDNHLTPSGQARLAACAAVLLGPLF